MDLLFCHGFILGFLGRGFGILPESQPRHEVLKLRYECFRRDLVTQCVSEGAVPVQFFPRLRIRLPISATS